MRRSRRGGHSALEFGGSGEDSFVAVGVTKLTGALLFILLLAMVIMALLPKVDPDRPDREAKSPGSSAGGDPLRIATPGTLPDAVAGRPYQVALAATGEDRPAVRSVGDTHDGILMSAVFLKFLAGVHVPETHEVIVTAGDRVMAIRSEGDAADGAAVVAEEEAQNDLHRKEQQQGQQQPARPATTAPRETIEYSPGMGPSASVSTETKTSSFTRPMLADRRALCPGAGRC